MSGTLIVVADGFYGSCGKGHVSQALTSYDRVGEKVAGVRVGGPNAGHIVYGACPPNCDPDTMEVGGTMGWGNEPKSDHWGANALGEPAWLGHPWKLRQVPVAAVSNRTAQLVIAAGSEVHLATLREELKALDAAGYDASSRLLVDASATLLTDSYIKDEKGSDLVKRLGSTAKGIGAARAARLWRTAQTVGEATDEFRVINRTDHEMRDWLTQGWTVLIEGTQGYGLGLHTQNYPQVTSGDCRAIDFLAQAGLSPWHDSVQTFEPWVVLRVRPIRVAGNSGPMKGETSWTALGLPEERTTVTRKVRRVGTWDAALARDAIEANGGTNQVKVALTMVDTVLPFMAQRTRKEMLTSEQRIELNEYLWAKEQDLEMQINWIGTGPNSGIWL